MTRTTEADVGPTEIDALAALAALVDRHAPFLYRVAFNLLRNPQEAEDAVQETLLKFVRNPAALAHLDDERAFLAAAVWRVGLNRVDSAQYRAQRQTRNFSDIAMPFPDPHPNPEQQAAELDQRTLMRNLIETLPDTLRQPLLLSAIEGMRGSEVASILGVPEATVRTRIHRAKAQLREAFLAATVPLQSRKQVRA